MATGRDGSVEMKDYMVPFAAAFVLCSVVFLALDFAVMNLQGLSLFFHQ